MDFGPLAYKAAARVARGVPGPVATGLGRAIGLVLGRAMGDRRSMVARHQQRVHGEGLAGPALDRAVQQAFDSYARYWVESFRLPSVSPAELEAQFTAEGLERVDAALTLGKGVIFAVPHLGGWDFGGAWFTQRGYPFTVVVEPVDPPELFEWFVEFRRSLGMKVVPLGPKAGGDVLRALRANDVVALLCDRDIGGAGVEVEFFGERTFLPAGPVTLSLRSGAPILPVAIYFDGARGHKGVVRPPLELTRSGRLRDDIAAGTQTLAVALEELIRMAPEQWHLMQPNWPSDPGYARDPRP